MSESPYTPDDPYTDPKTGDGESGVTNVTDEPATIGDGSVNPTFSGLLRSPNIAGAEAQFLPDPLAVALGTPCGPPEGCIAFKGFLSAEQACASGATHRLYTDDTFWAWLEIRKEDIRAQIAVPPDGYDPRSVIWVQREAKVAKCRVTHAYDLAEEVFAPDPGGLTIHPPWR